MMSRRRTPAVGQVAGLVVKRGGVWARNDPIRRTRSQRHGKAINHNTGRVSQRTQCRPRQPDWSSDLFRAPAWLIVRPLPTRATRRLLVGRPPPAGAPRSERRQRPASQRATMPTIQRRCIRALSNRRQRTEQCCAQLDPTSPGSIKPPATPREPTRTASPTAP